MHTDPDGSGMTDSKVITATECVLDGQLHPFRRCPKSSYLESPRFHGNLSIWANQGGIVIEARGTGGIRPSTRSRSARLCMPVVVRGRSPGCLSRLNRRSGNGSSGRIRTRVVRRADDRGAEGVSAPKAGKQAATDGVGLLKKLRSGLCGSCAADNTNEKLILRRKMRQNVGCANRGSNCFPWYRP